MGIVQRGREGERELVRLVREKVAPDWIPSAFNFHSRSLSLTTEGSHQGLQGRKPCLVCALSACVPDREYDAALNHGTHRRPYCIEGLPVQRLISWPDVGRRHSFVGGESASKFTTTKPAQTEYLHESGVSRHLMSKETVPMLST